MADKTQETPVESVEALRAKLEAEIYPEAE